jgi:hypothetical protein
MTSIKKLITTLLAATFVLSLTAGLSVNAQYGANNLGDGSGAFPAGPTSGTTGNITKNAGETLTLPTPVAGVDNIVFNFNSSVSGSIDFTLLPTSQIIDTIPSGTPILVLQFNYNGISKTAVNLVINFKIKTSYTGISAYYLNSPGVPITLTNNGPDGAGNNLFRTAGFGAPTQFAVAATGGVNTVRTGAFDIIGRNLGFFIGSLILVLVGAAVYILNARRLEPKVQR